MIQRELDDTLDADCGAFADECGLIGNGPPQPQRSPCLVRSRRPYIGVAGLTPQELRHTAAGLAVSAGANVKAVQRMFGHASAVMTPDRYADLFDDDLDAVAERLDAVARDSFRAQTESGPS